MLFFIMAAVGGNINVRFTYTYTGEEDIPDDVTHVIVRNIRVVLANAFADHPNIVEVIFHEKVEKIEENAFGDCPSMRRVIMRGVKIVEVFAFQDCEALTNVECGKLEIIKVGTFERCVSLRGINLPSARSVENMRLLSAPPLRI